MVSLWRRSPKPSFLHHLQFVFLRSGTDSKNSSLFESLLLVNFIFLFIILLRDIFECHLLLERVCSNSGSFLGSFLSMSGSFLGSFLSSSGSFHRYSLVVRGIVVTCQKSGLVQFHNSFVKPPC